MKNKFSNTEKNILLILLMLFIYLIPCSSQTLCQEPAESSDTTMILSNCNYDSLDLRLVNFALIKCEYIINENFYLKKQLLFKDSIINNLNNKPPIVQDKFILKHNWAITAIFTSLVLIVNYSIFFYLNK